MVGQHFVWVRGEDGLWDVRAEQGSVTSKRIDVRDGLVITNASSMPEEVQGRLRPTVTSTTAPKAGQLDPAAYEALWTKAVLEAHARRPKVVGEPPAAGNGVPSCVSGGIFGWMRPSAPPAEVDQERATISRETERERQILRAHIARSEAEERFEKWLMDAAAAGPRVNVGTLTAAEVPLEFRKVLRWEKRALITQDPELAFTAALASIVPDALRADADAGFTQFYAAHGEGLSDVERRSHLQECRAARLAAELAEERAIRAEEAAGGCIDRRDDADPAIVLAFDADLDGTTRPTTIDVARLHQLESVTAAIAAARTDAQERHRDAETDYRRAVTRRDAERASNAPVGRAIREETLAALEAAVVEHEAIVARYAAPLEAIAARWETLSRLARACRAYATQQGIDLPRRFEPGATAA